MSDLNNTQNTKNNKKTTWIIFLSLALVLGFGLVRNGQFSQKLQPAEALTKANELETPKNISQFYIDESFNHDALKNQWSFVFFGYTDCPDICPHTLGLLKQTQALVKDAKFYFVSINPTQDSKEKMKSFLTRLESPIQGITGDEEKITQLTKELYIHVTKDGAIDHSKTLLLINPEGQLHAIFSSPENPALIQKDFELLKGKYKKV